jgi:hypothetical protein
MVLRKGDILPLRGNVYQCAKILKYFGAKRVTTGVKNSHLKTN